MRKYYLAYGSNLSFERMKYRCRDSKVVGAGVLNDYQLSFKGREDGYSYLTIEECKGSIVPVGIYEISDIDESMLDRFEGYPSSYEKEYMDILLDGKVINALIYVMNKDFDYHIPTDAYMRICKKGYQNFFFDSNILEEAYNNTMEKVNENKQKKLCKVM